jgi:hypothetical protein
MGSHDPFGHFKHKLWPKEGSGVKLPIWLPTIKSKKSPRFPCVQVTCNIPLEKSWRGYNFASDLISIKGLHAKLRAPKIMEVPTMGISGFPFGSPGTKWHLGASLVAMHKVYYKGEGGGFPQVWAVVSLVSPSLSVACPTTKSALTMH